MFSVITYGLFVSIISTVEMYEKNEIVLEKHFGVFENALLNCFSIDSSHNFYYWYHADSQAIIGPYNEGDYDIRKYDYEVLSGNLTIRKITKKDAGLYDCVSRGVFNDGTRITSIKVVVAGEDIQEAENEVNSLRIILSICTLVLFCCFMYVAYRVWKDRYIYPRYLDQFDDDEDDTNEEIYRAPSSSGLIKESIVRETQKPLISTDFSSILDSKI